jgi:hypothetical protein
VGMETAGLVISEQRTLYDARGGETCYIKETGYNTHG